MPRLSVVVPVYNTEPYISRCLDSIIHQTFTDFELILVDDGSTDHCSIICDDYCRADRRVKVIHKSNEGVSSARNAGFEIASGDYLTVVDSDDWLEAEMYQTMFGYINDYGVDVVMCDCIKDYPDRSAVYTHDIRGGLYTYEQLKEEYYPHLLMAEDVNYPATISNYLIIWKRSITKDNGIKYLEGVKNSEDLLFGAQILSLARSFYYIKGNLLYHYCIRGNSSSQAFASDKWHGYIELHRKANEFFCDKSIPNIDHQINLMLLFFVYNCLGDLRKRKGAISERVEEAKSIINHDAVKRMFKTLKIYRLPISAKLKALTYLYKTKIGLQLVFRMKP